MAKAIEAQIRERYPQCTLEYYETEGDRLDIYLISNVDTGSCPECGEKSSSLHGRYVKKIADLPIDDKFITVHLKTKTLTCRGVCARKTFFPAPHSFLSDPQAKKTDRLVERILDIASANTVRGTVKACEKEHIKCDKNTVSRLLRAHHMRKCDLQGK